MSTQHNHFMKRRLHQVIRHTLRAPATSISALMLTGALMSSPVMAQQAGSIKGTVSSEVAGASVAGVTVTATSSVMPKARTTVTRENGSYTLPALLPGKYKITFTSADGTVRETAAEVFLDQTSNVSIALQQVNADNTEVIYVTASKIIREGNSSLTNSLGKDVIEKIPTGQNYRDILAIVPGVQYSEYTTLGPSAGGSGRDNKYGFDGVDISLPMFGNLASEPSSHDIGSVTVDRGGAKAVGFNRAGGLSINTLSKSGTNEFHADIKYQTQPQSLVADRDDTDGETYDLNKTWITTSVSGPLIEDQLFFYASYFRPEDEKPNKENGRGPVKDYSNIRDEYFGKLTWAPTDDLLLNTSYRTSERIEKGKSVGAYDADSTSVGGRADQDIFTFDGSYLISDDTVLTFQYNSFKLETAGGPDNLIPSVSPRIGDSLDLSRLDSLGLFNVPKLDLENPDYDSAAALPLINQYGYIDANGDLIAGGSVGVGSTIDNQDFKRTSFEISLDHDMEIGDSSHKMHIGFQWKENVEILSRLSNGWGSISFLGGERPDDYEGDIPVYYQARVQQMSLQTDSGNVVPAINSSSENFNLELNDEIVHGDFTYNVGILFSNDVLYGQGLKENSSNVSGYEVAAGHKYEMYNVGFADMIQPRLGISWDFSADTTLFANFASYNPEASSLARAASWARNSQKEMKVFFDQAGDYIADQPASGSSGKFFQENLKPRRTDEITIGMTKAVSNELLIRTHVRKRKALHPWEDVPNNARLYGDYESPFGPVPDDIAAKGLYIEELQSYRDEVGGSSYVIAELDGSKNTYYEWSIEGEYKGDNTYLNVSYVWSHYYGNYDQDITSGSSDGNLFIGSSNLGDGKGRQLWDGKYGNLNGDKPHVLKALGYYTTDWNADIGFNFVYQSGDVWEAWDGSLYGYSSSTIRYAEPAGSRREASHWQLDLTYTQNFQLTDDLELSLDAEIYNLFDNQTGYNYDPYVSNDTFGEARDLINPRRVQLSVSLAY
ncbi:TonB-dependent receptor [uncultured Paraglaciecola sp.]|uniref:TonB-dependent receptor n=1 Tax=uncultured Paraglaciecola sp. TaxID=1765024 RepID=UPI002619719C|nr:carboxypeptidase regulatory-like domain-containing protein [uncultured Paraglaciecola sp.]